MMHNLCISFPLDCFHASELFNFNALREHVIHFLHPSATLLSTDEVHVRQTNPRQSPVTAIVALLVFTVCIENNKRNVIATKAFKRYRQTEGQTSMSTSSRSDLFQKLDVPVSGFLRNPLSV
jgi:hypothetical protein